MGIAYSTGTISCDLRSFPYHLYLLLISSAKWFAGGFPGAMPGGMPGMAGMPGLNEILSDPEVLAAMQVSV